MHLQAEEMAEVKWLGNRQWLIQQLCTTDQWSVQQKVPNLFMWKTWLFEIVIDMFCAWLKYVWNIWILCHIYCKAPKKLWIFPSFSRLDFVPYSTSRIKKTHPCKEVAEFPLTVNTHYLFNLFSTGFQLSFHTYFSESQPPVYSIDQNNAITGKESSRTHLKTNGHRHSLTCLFTILKRKETTDKKLQTLCTTPTYFPILNSELQAMQVVSF